MARRLPLDCIIPEFPDLSFERALWQSGLPFVAGIDEAGRGALAGPVSAAAVILPPDLASTGLEQLLHGVRDSKEMTPAARQTWASRITCIALAAGVGFASAQEIDTLGIVPATRLAIQRALAELCLSPLHLLVDYLPLPDIPLPQTSLVKGDARSLSIAAASILAKTSRDALMCHLDTLYPAYGFALHKGYGVPHHLTQLTSLGPCPEHRRSFSWH
jgi:ribonuclease HII